MPDYCDRFGNDLWVPEAKDREAAIETARREFAHREGVPDWWLSATSIECERTKRDRRPHAKSD